MTNDPEFIPKPEELEQKHIVVHTPKVEPIPVPEPEPDEMKFYI